MYGTFGLFSLIIPIGVSFQVFVPAARSTGRQDRGISLDKRHQ